MGPKDSYSCFWNSWLQVKSACRTGLRDKGVQYMTRYSVLLSMQSTFCLLQFIAMFWA